MLMKQSKMHSQVTLISSLNKEVLNSYKTNCIAEHEEVDIFDWIFYPKDTNARFFKKKTRLFSKRKIG